MDEVQTEGSSSINEIELSKISVNPNQPRREFDETALGELADSISEIGIIQRNVKLSEAPSYGLPTILYDAESTGAKNHLSLAKELISKNKNK